MFLYLLQSLQTIIIDHSSPLQHCITLLIVSIVFVLICHLWLTEKSYRWSLNICLMLTQVTVSMVWVDERTYIIQIVAFFLQKINPSFAGAILYKIYFYSAPVAGSWAGATLCICSSNNSSLIFVITFLIIFFTTSIVWGISTIGSGFTSGFVDV